MPVGASRVRRMRVWCSRSRAITPLLQFATISAVPGVVAFVAGFGVPGSVAAAALTGGVIGLAAALLKTR